MFSVQFAAELWVSSDQSDFSSKGFLVSSDVAMTLGEIVTPDISQRLQYVRILTKKGQGWIVNDEVNYMDDDYPVGRSIGFNKERLK